MEKLYELASYASFIVYHIEAMDKIKIPKTMIREYINLQKTVGSYPKELNYVTSFYDKKTGSSGALFENSAEGNYILSVNVNIKMYKSDKIKMYNYSKLT